MSALLFALPDLDGHPDGALLLAIGEAGALEDAADLARRQSEEAFRQWVRANCHEAVRLADFIAATPATTLQGVRAKVEHALRDAEPEKCGCGSIVGSYQSVLWDVLRSGVLG